jgi:hypothetical protein
LAAAISPVLVAHSVSDLGSFNRSLNPNQLNRGLNQNQLSSNTNHISTFSPKLLNVFNPKHLIATSTTSLASMISLPGYYQFTSLPGTVKPEL